MAMYTNYNVFLLGVFFSLFFSSFFFLGFGEEGSSSNGGGGNGPWSKCNGGGTPSANGLGGAMRGETICIVYKLARTSLNPKNQM
jgi:hypothetical protein